jgi:hypothetical protein
MANLFLKIDFISSKGQCMKIENQSDYEAAQLEADRLADVRDKAADRVKQVFAGHAVRNQDDFNARRAELSGTAIFECDAIVAEYDKASAEFGEAVMAITEYLNSKGR